MKSVKSRIESESESESEIQVVQVELKSVNSLLSFPNLFEFPAAKIIASVIINVQI